VFVFIQVIDFAGTLPEVPDHRTTLSLTPREMIVSDVISTTFI